jgi:hypothetical protein
MRRGKSSAAARAAMFGDDPEDECPFLGTFPPLMIKAEGPQGVDYPFTTSTINDRYLRIPAGFDVKRL